MMKGTIVLTLVIIIVTQIRGTNAYLTPPIPHTPAPVNANPFGCSEDWIVDQNSGHCYKVFDFYVFSWYSAEMICNSRGGYLASITSIMEQYFFASILTDMDGEWWVGATRDSAAGGEWGWISGEPWADEILLHTDGFYYEDDPESEGCGYVKYWSWGLKVVMSECTSNSRAYVCEISSPVSDSTSVTSPILSFSSSVPSKPSTTPTLSGVSSTLSTDPSATPTSSGVSSTISSGQTMTYTPSTIPSTLTDNPYTTPSSWSISSTVTDTSLSTSYAFSVSSTVINDPTTVGTLSDVSSTTTDDQSTTFTSIGVSSTRTDVRSSATPSVGVSSTRADDLTVTTTSAGVSSTMTDDLSTVTTSVGISSTRTDDLSSATTSVGVSSTKTDALLTMTSSVVVSSTMTDGISTSSTPNVSCTVTDDLTTRSSSVGVSSTMTDGLSTVTTSVGVSSTMTDRLSTATSSVGVSNKMTDGLPTMSTSVGVTSTMTDDLSITNTSVGVSSTLTDDLSTTTTSVGVSSTLTDYLSITTTSVGVSSTLTDDLSATTTSVGVPNTMTDDLSTTSTSVGVSSKMTDGLSTTTSSVSVPSTESSQPSTTFSSLSVSSSIETSSRLTTDHSTSPTVSRFSSTGTQSPTSVPYKTTSETTFFQPTTIFSTMPKMNPYKSSQVTTERTTHSTNSFIIYSVVEVHEDETESRCVIPLYIYTKHGVNEGSNICTMRTIPESNIFKLEPNANAIDNELCVYLSWCPDHSCIEHQNVSEYFIIVTCEDTDGIATSKNIKIVFTSSAFSPSTNITSAPESSTKATLSTGKGFNDNVKFISAFVMGGIFLIVITVALTACVISKSKYRGVLPLNVAPLKHKRVRQTTDITLVPHKFPDPPPRVETDLFEQYEIPGLLIPVNDTALNVKRVHFTDSKRLPT